MEPATETLAFVCQMSTIPLSFNPKDFDFQMVNITIGKPEVMTLYCSYYNAFLSCPVVELLMSYHILSFRYKQVYSLGFIGLVTKSFFYEALWLCLKLIP